MKKLINTFYVLLYSLFIGIVSGCVVALFSHGLTCIQHIFQPIYLCFLSIIAVFITWLLQCKYPNCAKKKKKVFQNGQGFHMILPKKMIPITILTTWLTHLFGGSAGREGVGVQLGAMSAYHLTKHTSLLPKKDWIPIGMAAGFSALFQTPIAATMFALEVLQKGTFKVHLFIPTLCASYAAKTTTNFLQIHHYYYTIPSFHTIPYYKLILLGLLFGIIGMLFAWLLTYMKQFFASWQMNLYWKTFLTALCLACLLYITQARYSGLGTNLIHDAFLNHTIYPYDWILKLIFTVFTLTIGLQGGEVTPLFSIGTCLGVWIGPYVGISSILCAFLGYCAVFAAATKTILAPICIGLELFNPSYFPYICIVCSIAYACSRYSIYSQKRESD